MKHIKLFEELKDPSNYHLIKDPNDVRDYFIPFEDMGYNVSDVKYRYKSGKSYTEKFNPKSTPVYTVEVTKSFRGNSLLELELLTDEMGAINRSLSGRFIVDFSFSLSTETFKVITNLIDKKQSYDPNSIGAKVSHFVENINDAVKDFVSVEDNKIVLDLNKIKNTNYSGISNVLLKQILNIKYYNCYSISKEKDYIKIKKFVDGFKISKYGKPAEVVIANGGYVQPFGVGVYGNLNIKFTYGTTPSVESFYRLFTDSHYNIEIVDYDLFYDCIVYVITNNMSKSNYKIEVDNVSKTDDKIYIEFKDYIPKKRKTE